MCRFLETIKLKDGVFMRLDYHQIRLNDTRNTHFPNNTFFNLSDFLHLQDYPKTGIYKCRLVYDDQIRLVEFLPYQIRKIESLKLVETDMLSSRFKTENRSLYNELFDKKGEADDVLIVSNGFITDTSYCNIALFDGNKWLTPLHPLLFGTQRQFLIDQQLLYQADIAAKDLHLFSKIRLFNAMIEFGEIEISVNKII